MQTLTLMVHSQNYDIKVQDDFIIWLSSTFQKDFNSLDTNIKRTDLLSAYISKVYELYKNDKELNILLKRIEAQESLPNI